MSASPAWDIDWTPARAATAAVLLTALMALGMLATLYASSILFLLLNRADPREADLTAIVRYWRVSADDPRLRKKLVSSVAVPVAGFLMVLAAVALAAAGRRRPLHGDARFACAGEVARSGLLGAQAPSILVGRYRGRFLGLPGQLSVMLSAPTRSGKGVGVVIPNLLNWPDSVVVLDVKGENYDITAGYRSACGQAVFAFSPFDDEGRSHRWNPLTAVRTDPLHRVGDLLAIGQVFFPNDGGHTSSEAFFNDQARNLFLGIGLYLLETPELPRTIGEMLRQSSGKGRGVKEHFTEEISRRQVSRPLTVECVDAFGRLLANSENPLSSIVATFNAPLTIFADTVVDAATSADDFRLEEVRRRRISVYVRIPPSRLASARPLLNLFFSQLVSLNTQRLPEREPDAKLQCLLVNDEFAAMGRVGLMASAVAFLAGYNLRLLTVVQAMSQLDSVYGEKEARTFATNHGLQILYAPREQRDAEEYSAMLGHFTQQATARGTSRSFSQHAHHSISRTESDQRRALLLPQEFKELGTERLVIVTENCKPILARKIRYHREQAFSERLLPAPPVPRMDIERHLARVQQRWRHAPDELAPGQALDVEDLAHDLAALPEIPAAATPAQIEAAVDAFFEHTRIEASAHGGGGTIEPAARTLDPTDACGGLEARRE
jgi:type IV secretion system protein VirD4